MDKIKSFYVVEVIFRVPFYRKIVQQYLNLEDSYFGPLVERWDKTLRPWQVFWKRYVHLTLKWDREFQLQRKKPPKTKGVSNIYWNWPYFFRKQASRRVKNKVDFYLIIQRPIENPFRLPLLRYVQAGMYEDQILVSVPYKSRRRFYNKFKLLSIDDRSLSKVVRSEFPFYYVSDPIPKKEIEPDVLFVPKSRLGDLIISGPKLRLRPGTFHWAYDSLVISWRPSMNCIKK